MGLEFKPAARQKTERIVAKLSNILGRKYQIPQIFVGSSVWQLLYFHKKVLKLFYKESFKSKMFQ